MSPVEGLSKLPLEEYGIYCTDTNFVFALQEQGSADISPDNKLAISILEAIVNTDGFPVISSSVSDEILNSLRNTLITEHRRKNKSSGHLGSKQILKKDMTILPAVIQQRDNMIFDFLNLPSLVANFTLGPALQSAEASVVKQTGLDFGDARQLIIAKSLKPTGFLTLDSDFAKIHDPDLKIFIPDRHLISGTSGTIKLTIPTVDVEMA